MNEIDTLPNRVTNAGHEFSYASWSANTVVTLANVPWNSDYRDIVRFDTKAALDSFITNGSGPVLTIGDMTYTPMTRPVRLGIPFERANQYNYLRAYNPAQPGQNGDFGRAYYYFIAKVNYIAPGTTELILQLDVWQSFGYDVKFGNCYIQQGHIGIANQHQFDDHGRTYLTQPEGLDIGGEYQIVDQWQRHLATARNMPDDQVQDAYSILVTTTVAFDKDPGTVGAPSLNTASGSHLENLPNGADTYLFQNLSQFQTFMNAMSDKPWVTQGIISIMAVPPFSEYNLQSVGVQVAGVVAFKVSAGSLNTVSTPLKTRWRDYLQLPDRYRNLLKFKTSPYTILEMTSYTGTPLVLKPESWTDEDATVVELPHFAQPAPRIMFYPYRYNAAANGPAVQTDDKGVLNDGGEFLDLATGLFNFPQFTTVNNGYQSYMAANMNGIAFAHSSADWAQQRALAGNQLASDQAGAAIDTSRNITGQGINAATQQTNLANEAQGAHTMINGMGGMVMGAARGLEAGPAGAAGGAALGGANAVLSGINAAVDMNQRNQSLGVANTLARGVNDASTGQAGYVRDTNKAYGDMVAHGDYQNTIAGINAKVQDARMIQPTTSGQVGGDAFLLSAYKWGYDVKVKMLTPAAMAVLGEYWLRYGYVVNRFGRMPEGFMVCAKFTYWKLRETYIVSGACPESFKQTLRGIFEKGVTVWKNPNDIGNIDIADNAPLAGVTL